jgi:signal transduction histidine kinase
VLALLTVPDDVQVELPAGRNAINFSLIAFEQILINLLSNAIRYNDKETPIIRIFFAEDDDFYHLEIKDNGMGIPEELQEKIFDTNFTINAKDRFKKEGSGIGLSTVKDLLRLLESEIIVKSQHNKGSAFTVRLKK